MKKLISLTLAALMLLACLTGCAGQTEQTTSQQTPAQTEQTTAAASDSSAAAADGDTFLLGLYLPLSGTNATYGQQTLDSLNMAIDYVNKNGGLNGQQITTVVYDTTSSPEEAAKITVKMVEVDHVDAVISTPMSSEILSSVQTLMDAKILTFAQGTSGSIMHDDWTYLYRVAANNDYALPSVFSALQEIGYKKAAVFYSQDETSITQKNLFVEACEAGDVDVVAMETFDSGDTDFSAQIANIVAANPDVLYMAIMGDFTGIAIKQLRQYGYNGMLINKEDINTAQIDVAGAENCNYTMFAYPYVTYNSIDDCNIENMKEYLQMFYDTYGYITNSDWPLRGWDAVLTLQAAAEKAGANDSDSLKAAMDTLTREGLGGTIDFTKGHEGLSTFNTFVYADGQKTPLTEWMQNGGYDSYKQNTGRER